MCQEVTSLVNIIVSLLRADTQSVSIRTFKGCAVAKLNGRF